MAYKDPYDERAKAARRKHYENNKATYIARSIASKQEKRQWLHELKESSPCTDCGKFYPYYVMQYDHISNNKVASVSYLTTNSWKKLKDEIAKCELVCANCHAIRTHSRRT